MPAKISRANQPLRIPPPGGFGPLPFSNGILAGDTFYMSGHIGLDAQTKTVPASAEQEARLMLDAFRETLARASLSMNDLVYVQVFCSDVSLFERFNAIYPGISLRRLPGARVHRLRSAAFRGALRDSGYCHQDFQASQKPQSSLTETLTDRSPLTGQIVFHSAPELVLTRLHHA